MALPAVLAGAACPGANAETEPRSAATLRRRVFHGVEDMLYITYIAPSRCTSVIWVCFSVICITYIFRNQNTFAIGSPYEQPNKEWIKNAYVKHRVGFYAILCACPASPARNAGICSASKVIINKQTNKWGNNTY